jgi:hypothetical protein
MTGAVGWIKRPVIRDVTTKVALLGGDGYSSRMSASDTVDLYELRYTKAEMATAPEPERLLYLMATSLANDIQILLRQYLIAIKQDHEDDAVRNASSAIAMLNLRLLAGRFHEGWVLLEERWPGLEALYEPLISAKGRQALLDLRAHFMVSKTDNIVFMIRNKIGFHADYRFTKTMFDAAPNDVQMVEYVGQTFGDTLYFGTELTHYAALRRFTKETDDFRAFGAVMDELRTLQNLFLTFVNAFVVVFAKRHLAKQYSMIRKRQRTLRDLPAFEEMRIPYFADFSASLAATRKVSAEETGAEQDEG